VAAVFVSVTASAACVGDCGGDRSVTVDEIISMVSIALGNAAVEECDAGDANIDGQITVDEILAAVNNALNGCPNPEVTPTPTPTGTLIPPHVTIGSARGAAGAPVTVSISLAKNERNVITVAPLVFDIDPLVLVFELGGCRLSPQVTGKHIDSGPLSVSRVSLVVFGDLGDQGVIPDGVIVDCTLTIKPEAPSGVSTLAFAFAVIADPSATDILATGSDGSVTVE
jgi:hypothetical protein